MDLGSKTGTKNGKKYYRGKKMAQKTVNLLWGQETGMKNGKFIELI